MESDTTRALGGQKQELLTTDKLFPTLRFFFTSEGSSLVSQEVACLDLPSKHGVQALCSTWPGHLGLLRYEKSSHSGDPEPAHLTEKCVIDIPDGLQCQVRKPCLVGHHIQKLL